MAKWSIGWSMSPISNTRSADTHRRLAGIFCEERLAVTEGRGEKSERGTRSPIPCQRPFPILENLFKRRPSGLRRSPGHDRVAHFGDHYWIPVACAPGFGVHCE